MLESVLTHLPVRNFQKVLRIKQIEQASHERDILRHIRIAYQDLPIILKL